MSELQAALLAIGFCAVVAVYGFGWWQQRRYRRKFGETFKSSHADALYHGASLHAGPIGAAVLDDTAGEVAGAGAPGTDRILPDEPCALLDARSDFVVEFHLDEASPASVLGALWQRKFDFGKPVHVCGMALNSAQWERAIADSHMLYPRFRVALQMVDRSGAISAAKLAEFSDLALGIGKQIGANASAPDIHEAHQRAASLDAFCAEVDQVIGVNLVLPGERLLSGEKIAQAAALFGMRLESDGAFHLMEAPGWQGEERRRIARATEIERRRASHSVFSLVNLNAEPFRRNTLETTQTPGITLLLDMPRVASPALQFDRMMDAAQKLARELQADLVDDHLVKLTDSGLSRIREKIVEVETRMRDNGIAPGSAQALRLFA